MRDTRTFAHRLLMLGGMTSSLIIPALASAQEQTQTPAAPPTTPEQAVTPAPTPEPVAEVETAPPSAGAPAPAAPAAETNSPALGAEVEALKAQVAALKAKQEEAEMNALLTEEPVEVEEPMFKVYGFMDMGIQGTWVNKKALVAALFDTNAITFATGNINLYFDFNPHPDWRALAEIRFTGAPHGNIESFGGITGTPFERTNTQQYDPNGTVINAPVWGGYSVIERAYIEWNRYQQFQLLVGHFFTPFGIWNVDHGQPTLISLALPQFIQQTFMPLRQTGVQALGSFFAGDWEIAYRAWLTNGRTEENWLDYTNDKAFGGRVFVRNESGKVRTQIGASYHHGKVENKVVDITGAPPFTEDVEFNAYSTMAYHEDIFGLDLSMDIVDTRIRLEGISQLRRYEEGKRPTNGVEMSVPGTEQPDGWRQSAYLIVAQQLPWWGLEPYLYGEVMRQDWAIAGDGLALASVGLNIHFTPQAMLKTQGTMSYFFKWKQDEDFPGDPTLNNTKSITSRLVLAF